MFHDSQIMQITLTPAALKLSQKNLQLIEQKKLSLQVSVLDNQNKGKPALIFIHGNSTCKEVFKAQIDYFSKDSSCHCL
jgi:hypothetical protein